MASFSRTASADARAPCKACCRGDHARDDALSRATTARIAALASRREPVRAAVPAAAAVGAPDSGVVGCAQQARALAPVVQRFDRYREALPSARAAADLSELGDESGNEASARPCLTRLPARAGPLGSALGVRPGTFNDEDLRNDVTGFRAALYRDEGTGKLILVPRDTQPDSLVDWQANIRTGLGVDTPQYKAVRNLAAKLAANDQAFDIAGYSKGGGLAQQAGLMSGQSQVRLFNSAGAPDEMLGWSGKTDFESLASRTRAFSAEGDFVTFLNATTEPGQTIINARFLQRELAGQGPGLAPIDIQVRNPAMRGVDDPGFRADKQRYMDELMGRIDELQTRYDTGGVVPGLPPVRAASLETIPDSMTLAGRLLRARGGQPTLGKLAQHRMSAVLDALESHVASDRQRLQRFMRQCG